MPLPLSLCRRGKEPNAPQLCVQLRPLPHSFSRPQGARGMAPRAACSLSCAPCRCHAKACLLAPLTMLVDGSRHPLGEGSLLISVRAPDHLTFEINSVTSEEDLVTDVIEESDHKTLKTNKQTNLKNKTPHTWFTAHLSRTPWLAQVWWAQRATENCTSGEWRFYASLDSLQKTSRNSSPLKLNVLHCTIVQISPNHSIMEHGV